MFPQKNSLVNLSKHSSESCHQEVIGTTLHQLGRKIMAIVALESLELINSFVMGVGKGDIWYDGKHRVFLTAHHR